MRSRSSFYLFAFLVVGFAALQVRFGMSADIGIDNQIGNAISTDFFRPGLTIKNQVQNLGGVALSADKTSLGLIVDGRSLHLWDLVGGSQVGVVALPADVSAFKPLSLNRGTVVGLSSGEIALVSGGAVVSRKAAHTGAVVSLAASRDGSMFFSAGADGRLLRWTTAGLQGGALVASAPANIAAIACRDECDFIVAGTATGEVLKIDLRGGAAISLGKAGARIVQVAIAPDRATFAALTAEGEVLSGSVQSGQTRTTRFSDQKLTLDHDARMIAGYGGRATISLYDIASGQKISELSPQINMGAKPGNVVSVECSSQAGRLFTTAEGGVMRMWDLDAKRDLIQVFLTRSGWAVVDQNGRFDANETAMLDLGWAAKNQQVSFDQVADTYYAPGLMSDYLDGASPSTRAEGPSIAGTGLKLPPVVEILFPKEAPALSPSVQTWILARVADQGGGIGQVRMYHNGKLLPPGAVIQQQEAGSAGHPLRVVAFQITPTPGIDTFLATASTNPSVTQGQSIIGKSELITKTMQSATAKPVLHLVAVGINQYANVEHLNYAVEDAKAFAESLQRTALNHYQSVDVKLLIDGAATRTGITAALGALANSKPEDVVVLYFAGHGVITGNDWMFVSQEANFDGHGLTAAEIEEQLIKAPAQRTIVLLDSCTAGQSAETFKRFQKFQRRFILELSRSAGITVLAGAKANAGAAEVPQFGHGLFTYALLDGLAGKADAAPRDGVVSAHEIVRYASTAVPDLSSRVGVLQQPAYFAIGADFAMN